MLNNAEEGSLSTIFRNLDYSFCFYPSDIMSK